MMVYLYINPKHYKFVDKRPYLQPVASIDCNLKLPCSILSPTLEISKDRIGDIANFNYAYIPEFHRYYFLTEPVADLGGVAKLSFNVDPLTSNANAILGLRCQVERQQYNYNMDLPDSDIPVMAKRNLTYRNFASTPFTSNPSGRHYTLTVSGSSKLEGGVVNGTD